MERRSWTLANRGLSVGIALDDVGRLSCASLLDRRTGRQWIHGRLPSDEIILEVARADGGTDTLCGVDGWDLADVSVERAEWESLTLSLSCRSFPLVVHRTWALHKRLPILRVRQAVENTGRKALELLRADTFRLRLAPASGDLHLRWLNNYCRGLKPRPSHPVHSRSVGENIRHVIETGPYSPDCAWFTLHLPGDPEEGIVGGWEWSGPMAVAFGDDGGPCLVSGGLSREGMHERVEPGERFEVPAGWIGFYRGGIDDASHLSHSFTALVAPRFPRWMKNPPLGYCTWADSLDGQASPFVPPGTNPWFPTEKNVLSQVQAAAEAGFELFILDYGWFPRVGDWRCDPSRFPDGPGRVVRAVKAAGMKLGLWMGFAAADAQAEVVRAHPEWLASYGGAPIPDAFPLRCSAKVWNTRVLCLGHRPAAQWMAGEIARVVEELEVDWLKHDFDTVTLCQSREHTHTPGDGRIAMCEGFYRVLDSVRSRFPDLVIDNWESDSALPDYGMIRRHQIHLIGDAYAAFLLRQMYYGASRLFPPVMLHRYLRLEDSDTDMRTSLRSAMVGGPLTLLSDPRKWDPERMRIFREEAALYRKVRGHFRSGTPWCPLGRPTETGWDAFQFSSRGTGALFVFRNESPQETARVPLRGLVPEETYRVLPLCGGRPVRAAGRRLETPGLRVTLALPRSSAVFTYGPGGQE